MANSANVLADDALVSDGGLHVAVVTAGIVVTMPGTDFLIAYRMVKDTSGLVAAKMRDDSPSKVSQAEFLAQA